VILSLKREQVLMVKAQGKLNPLFIRMTRDLIAVL
jgi:hypothetical protein